MINHVRSDGLAVCYLPPVGQTFYFLAVAFTRVYPSAETAAHELRSQSKVMEYLNNNQKRAVSVKLQ